ncbi:hypothetical protein HJC23_005543, partial [Cyclotella cryptica]
FFEWSSCWQHVCRWRSLANDKPSVRVNLQYLPLEAKASPDAEVKAYEHSSLRTHATTHEASMQFKGCLILAILMAIPTRYSSTASTGDAGPKCLTVTLPRSIRKQMVLRLVSDRTLLGLISSVLSFFCFVDPLGWPDLVAVAVVGVLEDTVASEFLLGVSIMVVPASV